MVYRIWSERVKELVGYVVVCHWHKVIKKEKIALILKKRAFANA